MRSVKEPNYVMGFGTNVSSYTNSADTVYIPPPQSYNSFSVSEEIQNGSVEDSFSGYSNYPVSSNSELRSDSEVSELKELILQNSRQLNSLDNKLKQIHELLVQVAINSNKQK